MATVANPFASKVTDPKQLEWHRVYIVAQNFYGKDPKTGILREYPREEVEKEVITTLGITKTFVEPAITQDTTLLIVPDHWNRVLPGAARQYKQNLSYLPFSFILYPKVTDEHKMLQLQAPPDAAYRIMEEKQNKPIPPESFVIEKVAPDRIMRQFQGFLYATAKRMEPMKMNNPQPATATTTTTTTATTATNTRRSPSVDKKERQRARSVEREERQRAKSVERAQKSKEKEAKKSGGKKMTAGARSMYADDNDDGDEDDEEDYSEYERAWAQLRARITTQKA